MTLNMVVVGVGGQGILLLARAIGEAVLSSSDLNVSIAETHGLSQRGGSVITHIRIGKGIFAPTIAEGDADVMLALELIEAARYSSYLRYKESIAVIDDRLIRPSLPKVKLPNRDELIKYIQDRTCKMFILKGFNEALKRGSPLSANMALFGFISSILERLGVVKNEVSLKIVSSLGRSERVIKVNKELYLMGYEEASRLVSSDVLSLLKKRLLI